jgi:hypothetical protein
MASFAAQVRNMFFVLVERVTGYGGHAEDQKDASSGNKQPNIYVVLKSEKAS